MGASGSWDGEGGVALAAPDKRANCLAVLTSHYGPQGQVHLAVQILLVIAAARGMPPGELAVLLAGEHGTVDECLAVLDQLPAQP